MRSCHRHAVYVTPTIVLALMAVACRGTPDQSASIPVSDATKRAVASAGSTSPHGQAPLGAPSPSPLPPLARAALDSGNAQLRAKRYDAALASYRRAVVEAPGHVAPEFGVYMAAKRMGNTALADSTLRIINAHTAGSPMWTDSAMRRAHGAQPLPPAHPAL
jgi:hypothetical protein